MKKVLSIFAATSLLLCGFSTAEGLDFSTYSTDSLNKIHAELDMEIAKRIVQQTSTLTPANAYDGEIIFRGIPWGTNVNEVRTKLANDGMISNNHPISADDYITPWAEDEEWRTKSEAGAVIKGSNISESFTVAGYHLRYIDIDCAYNYTADSVDRSFENTKLISAQIKFEINDGDLVFVDLSNKLSSIYGEAKTYSETKSAGHGSDKTDYYDYWAIWYGSNNTGITLHHSYALHADSVERKIESVELTYGKTDGVAYLEGFVSALANEKKAQDAIIQQQNANNTDGL